jgi:hypothetical protein
LFVRVLNGFRGKREGFERLETAVGGVCPVRYTGSPPGNAPMTHHFSLRLSLVTTA